MRRYSWTIREQMADQELGENLEKNSEDGMSVSVRRALVDGTMKTNGRTPPSGSRSSTNGSGPSCPIHRGRPKRT